MRQLYPIENHAPHPVADDMTTPFQCHTESMRRTLARLSTSDADRVFHGASLVVQELLRLQVREAMCAAGRAAALPVLARREWELGCCVAVGWHKLTVVTPSLPSSVSLQLPAIARTLALTGVPPFSHDVHRESDRDLGEEPPVLVQPSAPAVPTPATSPNLPPQPAVPQFRVPLPPPLPPSWTPSAKQRKFNEVSVPSGSISRAFQFGSLVRARVGREIFSWSKPLEATGAHVLSRCRVCPTGGGHGGRIGR